MTNELPTPIFSKWRCDVNSDHEEFVLDGKIYRREDLVRLREEM